MTPKIAIIEVPYDSGRLEQRMGAGPGHLLRSGLADDLRRRGHEVAIASIRLDGPFLTEVTSGVDAMRRVALEVSKARRENRIPIVLSGHCGASVGTVCGLGPRDTGLLWFDAHGDLNTPEVSPSGYFDGMGFAMLLGHGWDRLARSIPGFTPLPASQAALLAPRDLDDGEVALIERTGLLTLTTEELRTPEGLAALESLAGGVSRLHLHVDMDAFDESIVRGNQLAVSGGVTLDELLTAVRAATRRAPLAAIGLASYDPSEDAADAGPGLVRALLGALFDPC